MAVQHYRKPRDRSTSRNKSSDRATDDSASAIADAEHRAEYTRDVLTQYRRYVATTLEPELNELRGVTAELNYDLELARESHDETRVQLEATQAELKDTRSQLDACLSEAAGRVRAATQHHDDHVAALKSAATNEQEKLRSELREVRRELEQLRAAGYDPEAPRRLAAMQSELDVSHEANKVLKRRVSELEQSVATADNERLEATTTYRAVGDVVTEVSGLVRESAEYASSVAAVFAHIDCPCPEMSNVAAQWRSSVSLQPVDHDGVLQPASAASMCEAISKTRAMLQQEHAAAAAGLRRLVLKHTELLETAASVDHDRHHERELARRRIDELEEDVRAEREAMMQALERERVKARLAAGTAGAGPSSPSGAAATAKRADGLDAAGRAPRSTVSSWCQTGPELLGLSGDNEQAARMMEEVLSLHGQLSHQRETIQLLEQQRQLFMDFVDDEFVAAHVQEALTGSTPTDMFMLHGV